MELRNVSKRFGDYRAVQNLSLEVRRGEFYFLLGPSGSGKTTTLRLIAGLERPDEGGVYLDGELVNRVPPDRRKTALVFQNYALFPHRTVFGNVAFGPRMRKWPRSKIRERVRQYLEMVQLWDLRDRWPSQLSGGQQQRVALARALIVEPAVLLLDEPLSNLDLKLRHHMRTELRRLQRSLGITAVYVTHDQGEALGMADRIAVIHGGHLAQVGTPAGIYERPGDPFVAAFIGDTNFLRAGVIEETSSHYRLAVPSLGTVLRGPKARPLAVGQAVLLSVRPERLRLRPDGEVAGNGAGSGTESRAPEPPDDGALEPPDDGALEPPDGGALEPPDGGLPGTGTGELLCRGRVEDIIYQGAVARYLVRTSGGVVLKADAINRGGEDWYEIGRPVAVYVPGDSLALLPEPAEAPR